jgi:hypothetical protein
MKTIETRAHIGADGMLHLNLPVDLPESEVEVLVVLQSLPENGHAQNGAKSQSEDEVPARGWPPGFFEQTFGAFADEPLERPEQGEYEVRDELL